MDKEQNKEIGGILAEIVTGARHLFKLKGKRFVLYPLSFAKTFRRAELIESLSINPLVVKINPYIEALRLAESKRMECCKFVALYATPNTEADFYNTQEYLKKVKYLDKHLSRDGLAMLFIYVLTADKSNQIVSFFEIDKEREKVQAILDIKAKSKNTSIPYGGKSIFGTLLFQLKEMGYTDREILFERPHAYLQLMSADKPGSIYLSEDEYESVPQKYGGSLIMADDPSSMADIAKMAEDLGIDIVES